MKSRWIEHIYEVLNKPEPQEPTEIDMEGIKTLPFNVEPTAPK